MKKLIYISAFVLLLTISQNAFAAFSDVSSDHVNKDAIEYVQTNKIVQGYPDGSYGPDRTINRAEFTKIIVESVFPGQANGEKCFPDVQTEWFAKYVCFAKSKGIIGGYPDGTFQPSRNVTFSEASKIISNGFSYKTEPDDIWFRPYVRQLAEKKAIPLSINSFTKNISRAEMAEMIYRLKANVTNKLSYTYEAIENLNNQPICNDSCGDLQCQENVCLGEGCPCAETVKSCPQDCSKETKMLLDNDISPEYTLYTKSRYENLLGNEAFVLFFHAQWCTICRQYEHDIQEMLKTFPDRTIFMEIDFDTELEMRKKYKITTQYTFVVIDDSGDVVKTMLGPKIDDLKKAISDSITF